MLRKTRSTPLSLTRFIYLYQQQQRAVRQLGTKPSNRCTHKNKDDDKKIHSPIKHQEDYIFFHKSKGQHILTNQRVLDSIVRKSSINPDDTVLEIGPGTGNLTLKLLEVSKKVHAIEIDERMVEILNRRAADRGFQDRLNVS